MRISLNLIEKLIIIVIIILMISDEFLSLNQRNYAITNSILTHLFLFPLFHRVATQRLDNSLPLR